MDVDLKENPSAVGEFLKSDRCRVIVHDIADLGVLLYQAHVAKRSGALARTAHASTEIGGSRHDRWIGVLSVASLAVAYEAAHEFGYQQPLSEGVQGPREFIRGHHDLNFVLEQLEAW